MTFDFHRPKFVPLDQALAMADQGWLAQFRGSGLIGDWIRLAAGGGPHTHSAMLQRTPAGVDLIELREMIGGRILPLTYHAKHYPGRIDLFSPNDGGRWPEWDAEGAVRVMRGLACNGYGYRSVLRVGLRHMPIAWRFYPVETRDVELGRNDSGIRPFCSHAVAMACRLGGQVDPVPRLPDWLVEPCHLTWSLFWRYECSIAPPALDQSREGLPWSSAALSAAFRPWFRSSSSV